MVIYLLLGLHMREYIKFSPGNSKKHITGRLPGGLGSKVCYLVISIYCGLADNVNKDRADNSPDYVRVNTKAKYVIYKRNSKTYCCFCTNYCMLCNGSVVSKMETVQLTVASRACNVPSFPLCSAL